MRAWCLMISSLAALIGFAKCQLSKEKKDWIVDYIRINSSGQLSTTRYAIIA
jgi:hypothetical protein